MAEPTIVLAGGGSAGHVNPLLALAAELRRRHPGVVLRALGTAEGLEARLVPEAGIDLVTIAKVPLPRRPSMDVLRFPGRWSRAMAVARRAVAGADVVVGFGGYVSTPAYMAARKAKVPFVIHEQNARPGLANRLGARSAAAVGVTFAGTQLPGATLVGLPLRAEILTLLQQRQSDAGATRREGAQALGLDSDRQILLVTGGSLGAQRINEAVSAAAAELLRTGAQVLHLTGIGKDGAVAATLGEVLAGVDGVEPDDYQVRPYLSQMQHALACADLIVSRSGAGTVAENSAVGLPAVYVPLPIGNGEQRLNAAGVIEAGGGLAVSDGDLTADWVRTHVTALLADSEQLAAMGRRAAAVGVRDGAARLADLVENAMGSAR